MHYLCYLLFNKQIKFVNNNNHNNNNNKMEKRVKMGLVVMSEDRFGSDK